MSAQRNTKSKKPPVLGKRSASTTTASSSKRIKSEPVSQKDGGGGLTDDAIAALNDRGTIGKVRIFFQLDGEGWLMALQQTVAVLKEYLDARGQSTAGKKADLIERVQEYLESKGL